MWALRPKTNRPSSEFGDFQVDGLSVSVRVGDHEAFGRPAFGDEEAGSGQSGEAAAAMADDAQPGASEPEGRGADQFGVDLRQLRRFGLDLIDARPDEAGFDAGVFDSFLPFALPAFGQLLGGFGVDVFFGDELVAGAAKVAGVGDEVQTGVLGEAFGDIGGSRPI